MSEQAPLFGDLWRQTAPKAMPETASRDAALDIRTAKGALHHRILKLITERGPLTDEAIQVALEMNPSTERPRRIELVKAGKLRPAGEGRTVAGCRATLWDVVWTEHP